VINGLQHVFEKRVEQMHHLPREEWRYFEKGNPHHTSTKFQLRLIR